MINLISCKNGGGGGGGILVGNWKVQNVVDTWHNKISF